MTCETCATTLEPSPKSRRFCPSCRVERERARSRARQRRAARRRAGEPVLEEARRSDADALAIFQRFMEKAPR